MKSETITELAGALAMAQAEMPAAEMNAVNPFLQNKYADLGSIIRTAQPILKKHGLSVSQMAISDNGNVGVETMLMHKSGEYIGSIITLPIGDEKGKSLAQVAGSIITYLRRYSYAAILGMYADEDTDGNQLPSDNGKPPPVKQVTHSKPSERPYGPQHLMKGLDHKAMDYKEKGWTANDKQRGLAAGMLSTCFDGDDQMRYTVTGYITAGECTSFKDVPDHMVLAILDWLKPEKDDDGQYVVGEYVVSEANALYNEAVKSAGQQEMGL